MYHIEMYEYVVAKLKFLISLLSCVISLVVTLKVEDRGKFLDAITTLLM